MWTWNICMEFQGIGNLAIVMNRSTLGLFQKLSWGGPQALFCLVGGGCFVDNVSKGWGVTCPGGQGIFDP